MTTQAKIEQFILTELVPGGQRAGLDPNEPLVSSGVIDSLGMLRLITFLEDDLGIKVADGDVLSDNFDTLQKITTFVEQRSSGHPKVS
jgi:acyl carrier protein